MKKAESVQYIMLGPINMIPAGYMAKRISNRPNWLEASGVADVYSVSNCVSKDFADYINYWKHNGYWLFDSPELIRQVAEEHSIDLTGTKLFYYEVHEFEFHEDDGDWHAFEPEPSFNINIVEPRSKHLEGYDVVTFSAGTSPEFSPLSCNSLAKDVRTNQHCLLDSFKEARQCLEQGIFNNSEPGPYRIFAVYAVEWPNNCIEFARLEGGLGPRTAARLSAAHAGRYMA